jgi:hypothetical protein
VNCPEGFASKTKADGGGGVELVENDVLEFREEIEEVEGCERSWVKLVLVVSGRRRELTRRNGFAADRWRLGGAEERWVDD